MVKNKLKTIAVVTIINKPKQNPAIAKPFSGLLNPIAPKTTAKIAKGGNAIANNPQAKEAIPHPLPPVDLRNNFSFHTFKRLTF